MGFKQSVISAKGCSSSDLCRHLGFDGPGTPTSDGLNVGVFAAETGDWATVAADGADHFHRLTPEMAATMDAPVVLYFVNYEVTMDTELAVFADGDLVWRVHVHWEGMVDVTVQGAMPAELREQLLELGDDATYGFPQALLEHTTGFDLREHRDVVLLHR